MVKPEMMVAKGSKIKAKSNSNVSSRMMAVTMMASRLSQTRREARDVSSLTKRTRLVVASHSSLEALEEASNAETEIIDHQSNFID